MNNKDGKNYKYRNRRKSSAGKFISNSVITTLLAYVVKDLLSEDSKLIQISNKLFHRKITDSNPKPQIIEAEFQQIKEKD